jgi:hypothetical protein
MSKLNEIEDRRDIVTVGHDLTRQTKSGPIDGVLKLVISHPMKNLCEALVGLMAKALLDRHIGYAPLAVEHP